MDKLALLALRTPVMQRTIDHGLCRLRYVGRRTGQAVDQPVQFARHGTDIVVYVGDAAGEPWWDTFTQPHPVEVMIMGDYYHGVGQVVTTGTPERANARALYRGEYPRIRLDDAKPLLLISLAAAAPVPTLEHAVSY